MWHHGDYVELTEHDGVIIYGRSDAALNPGGVRIGTAEIYRQVEQVPEVLETLVIGQEWDGDERIVLFVRLREGTLLTPALTGSDPRADPRGTRRRGTCPRDPPGAGHPAHPQRQDRRARGSRRRARPAGEEPRCARESRGAGTIRDRAELQE